MVGLQVIESKKSSPTISAWCVPSYTATAVLLFSISLMSCQHQVWENSLDSPDQLGLAVVDALNSRNIEKLNEFRVQRGEYLSWIFPVFPKTGLPADFAWSNLNKKCNVGMKRWIKRLGGRNLRFVEMRFDKPTQTYDGFELLRGTVLRVKNATGQELDLKILGSVVKKNNRYKLLSYDD